MAATGACLSSFVFSGSPSPERSFSLVGSSQNQRLSSPSARTFAISASSAATATMRFFNEVKDLTRTDGGSPRWFSPLECGSRLEKSPLLLYLPGIDGTGAGLTLQYKQLGKVFDIWCLHIPVMDRTSFPDLVELVKRTIKAEAYCSPDRPIYLVGESLGNCLALAVAARNPDIDLLLILANPVVNTTSITFAGVHADTVAPKLSFHPQSDGRNTLLVADGEKGEWAAVYMCWGGAITEVLLKGDPSRTFKASTAKGLPPQQTVGELSKDFLAIASYKSVLSDILPKETLLWKLHMLKSASAYTNSLIHAVKAQTLLLTSGKDKLLPSLAEGARLDDALQRSDLRKFDDCGHFLFLGGFSLSRS